MKYDTKIAQLVRWVCSLRHSKYHCIIQSLRASLDQLILPSAISIHLRNRKFKSKGFGVKVGGNESTHNNFNCKTEGGKLKS